MQDWDKFIPGKGRTINRKAQKELNQIIIVVALGTFMSALDSSIVNISDNDSSNYNNNRQAILNVEFMVQISSSKNPIPLNSDFFKGLKNVEELKTTDGYKYVIGRKPSYDKIQEYSKIIKNYFPDAFVIALRNGKIIPVKEALKEIKD